MSPAVDPSASIPDAPPPPPIPITTSMSLPASPARSPSKMELLKPVSSDTASVGGGGGGGGFGGFSTSGGMKRQSSFSSLLQKFASDQHFAPDWLELDVDDDAHSVVSVDSVSSSVSGNLSRHGSYVDLKDAAGVSAKGPVAGLNANSVAQLDRKMDALKMDPHRKKLSQAMIWTWLTTSTQPPLPEDDSVIPKAGVKLSADGKTSDSSGKEVKIDTEKLRARLMKTYPKKYYRDLNATSPNNW